MTQRPGHLTTIVVEKETLKTLRHMARKDETYTDLINSLINMRLQQETVNVSNNNEIGSSNGPQIGTLSPSEISGTRRN